MRNKSIRRLVGSGLVVGGLTMGALAVAGPVASSGAAAAKAGTTTLTVAEPPQDGAFSDYPFYTAGTCETANIDYWNLAVRPGYWFGLGNNVSLQPNLSIFNAPTFGTSGGNTTVTVTIKPWEFSNGKGGTEPVDNASVAQFLNIDQSGVKDGNAACAYAPGYGLPDQVTNVSYAGGQTGHSFTMTFQGNASHTWIEDNQLSQIIPLPAAFDVTSGSGAPGSGNCATADFNTLPQTSPGTGPCSAVFNYMSSLTMQSSLWQWADGPYRQFSAQYASGVATGLDVMKANTQYSDTGFAAKAAKTIIFEPESGTSTEINQLEKNKLDIGYVDPSDLTRAPGVGKVGKNTLSKLSHYNPISGTIFGTFYWEYNFDNAHSTFQTKGPLPAWAEEINNAYFRADIQESINQLGIIQHVDNGYADPNWSAVPAFPKTGFNSGIKNPYPYSTTKGKAQMKAEGWNTSVYPAVCDKAGAAGCGTVAFPIKKGDKAQVELLVPGGDNTVKLATQDTVSEVHAGSDIQIIPTYRSAQTYVGPACFQGAHLWELCGYGGWIYAPDFYPTGEVLFGVGAGSNVGGYGSAEMQSLLTGTLTGSALNQNQAPYNTSYGEYTAQNLPFNWQPVPSPTDEFAKSLKGNPPPNPLADFNPEFITAI
jgi:peptide/nickel transport system substrate-binding protein